MARYTTFIGLTERAERFLEEYEAVERTEKGQYVYYDPFNPIESMQSLPAYKLNNGSWVYEKEQADIWSSGPNIFTHLVDAEGNSIDPKLDWTEEEMYAIIG